MCTASWRYGTISTDRHLSGQGSICSKGKRVVNAITQIYFIIVVTVIIAIMIVVVVIVIVNVVIKVII
jgi:hypothetical protein